MRPDIFERWDFTHVPMRPSEILPHLAQEHDEIHWAITGTLQDQTLRAMQLALAIGARHPEYAKAIIEASGGDLLCFAAEQTVSLHPVGKKT